MKLGSAANATGVAYNRPEEAEYPHGFDKHCTISERSIKCKSTFVLALCAADSLSTSCNRRCVDGANRTRLALSIRWNFEHQTRTIHVVLGWFEKKCTTKQTEKENSGRYT